MSLHIIGKGQGCALVLVVLVAAFYSHNAISSTIITTSKPQLLRTTQQHIHQFPALTTQLPASSSAFPTAAVSSTSHHSTELHHHHDMRLAVSSNSVLSGGILLLTAALLAMALLPFLKLRRMSTTIMDSIQQPDSPALDTLAPLTDPTPNDTQTMASLVGHLSPISSEQGTNKRPLWRLAPHPSTPLSLTALRSLGHDQQEPLLIPSQSPKDEGKYTIVLDMDETLLTSSMRPIKGQDPKIQVLTLPFDDGDFIYSMVRPGAMELVAALAQHCEVVLWTAGTEEYARKAMEYLDPTNSIRHSIYRDDSWFQMPSYVKDLRRLGRPMNRVLLVDNSASVCIQPFNAIIVADYTGHRNDDLLHRLLPLLKGLIGSKEHVPQYLLKATKDGSLIPRGYYFCMNAVSGASR